MVFGIGTFFFKFSNMRRFLEYCKSSDFCSHIIYCVFESPLPGCFNGFRHALLTFYCRDLLASEYGFCYTKNKCLYILKHVIVLNKIVQNTVKSFKYLICVSVGPKFGYFCFSSGVTTIIPRKSSKKFNSSSV